MVSGTPGRGARGVTDIDTGYSTGSGMPATSAIPHFRQRAGLGDRTSGSMGHTHWTRACCARAAAPTTRLSAARRVRDPEPIQSSAQSAVAYRRKKLSFCHCGRDERLATSSTNVLTIRLNWAAASNSTGCCRSSDGA